MAGENPKAKEAERGEKGELQMTKHQRECVAVCRAEGLHPLGIEPRGRHYAIVCDGGQSVFSSCTPSDRRTIRNLRAFARRLARSRSL